jgi:hypothetical protein
MVTPTHINVHGLADASKARALLAVLIPIAFPFIMALALGKSGHSISDYPDLIANGQLSLFRQGVMWLAMVTFVAVYVPPAVTALGSSTYLASTPTQLVTPSGEHVDLAKVEAISVRKTFWHKVLSIHSEGETRKVVVTFARPSATDIGDALKADDNLRNITVF